MRFVKTSTRATTTAVKRASVPHNWLAELCADYSGYSTHVKHVCNLASVFDVQYVACMSERSTCSGQAPAHAGGVPGECRTSLHCIRSASSQSKRTLTCSALLPNGTGAIARIKHVRYNNRLFSEHVRVEQ